MRRWVWVICAGIAVPLAVSGCSQIKTAFGLEKQVPNEFDVVQNAPLAIPPDFNLRPPRPGAAPTQGESPTVQAKETIFRAAGEKGTMAGPDAKLSPGEDDILRAAGANNTPGDIRQVVNQEDAENHPFDKSFVDRVMFWREDKKAQKEILDPVKETARLQTTGDRTVSTQFSTPPTIDRKSDSGSFLDRLF
jgi:hypothetical protein